MNIEIRDFHNDDANTVSMIICRNLQEVNSRDYEPDIIKNFVDLFTPEKIVQIAGELEHKMFVACRGNSVVGTASLARDNRTTDKKYVCLTVFVMPEYHRAGIGTKLMNRVEEAARAKGAIMIQVPSSIAAQSFYHKRGYTENAHSQSNSKEPCIWMTKFFNDSKEKQA